MPIPSTAVWTEPTAADRRSDTGRGVGLCFYRKEPAKICLYNVGPVREVKISDTFACL